MQYALEGYNCVPCQLTIEYWWQVLTIFLRRRNDILLPVGDILYNMKKMPYGFDTILCDTFYIVLTRITNFIQYLMRVLRVALLIYWNSPIRTVQFHNRLSWAIETPICYLEMLPSSCQRTRYDNFGHFIEVPRMPHWCESLLLVHITRNKSCT